MIENEGGTEYAANLLDEATGLSLARPVFVSVADSSDVTNVTALTAYDVRYVVPANTLGLGSVLRFQATVRITAANLAETIQVEARLEAVVIVQSGAEDPAPGDTVMIEGFVTSRAAAGANIDCVGGGTIIFSTGAAGTLSTPVTMADGVTLATDAAQTLDFRVVYSAAGGNTSKLESLFVWIA